MASSSCSQNIIVLTKPQRKEVTGQKPTRYIIDSVCGYPWHPIWSANKVLKEYLLKMYSVNQRVERLEYRVTGAENKIDFFVRTSLPPVQGIFYDGLVFDAYTFAYNLIRSAKKSIDFLKYQSQEKNHCIS